MKTVRIFLLILILIGLGLIATYHVWVPKIVGAILTHESHQEKSNKDSQPVEVVKTFYAYWLEQVQKPHFDPRNRAYARDDLVTAHFIQTIDIQVHSPFDGQLNDEPNNSDLIFCAQDVPIDFSFSSVELSSTTAEVLVAEQYDRINDVLVKLINQSGTWKIDHVVCP